MATTQSSIVGALSDYTAGNLKGVKGFKGEKGDKGFAPVVARGYASGGSDPPGQVNTIDSFPFSTPFVTATDVGDLNQARGSAAGQSSSTNGYTSGGFISPAPSPTNSRVNTIDSFPFSAPFTTATDVGDLSQSRNIVAGQSSSNDGYTSGGLTGGPPFVQVNTIDSFPFSASPLTVTDVGNLNQARDGTTGQSSSSDGYTSGGSPSPTGTIDSFPFSTPFTTATDVGDLSQARSRAAGQSSSTDGYTSGGFVPPQVNTIDSFPFSTPFTTATDVGDISQARLGTTGQSSSSDGYTSGGFAPPGVNTIDSFPFASPFTTASDVGDLSQARSYAAGQQG